MNLFGLETRYKLYKYSNKHRFWSVSKKVACPEILQQLVYLLLWEKCKVIAGERMDHLMPLGGVS